MKQDYTVDFVSILCQKIDKAEKITNKTTIRALWQYDPVRFRFVHIAIKTFLDDIYKRNIKIQPGIGCYVLILVLAVLKRAIIHDKLYDPWEIVKIYIFPATKTTDKFKQLKNCK